MNSYRIQYPILQTQVYRDSLIYFDNAATTQKPESVIGAISKYYEKYNSNIHRGAHYLANLATDKYERVRNQVAQYINCQPQEVIFTSGTTQSINLLVQSWGRKFLQKGDEIVLTEMEHHANIVPWLALQSDIGFEIRYIPMSSNCTLELTELNSIISPKTKLVSLAYISNAMGTIHPISDIIAIAKRNKALVHIDAAQAIQHLPIDVSKLDIDFLSFSAHKMYGPMGVGVFWGKSEHLLSMNPYLYGGEMIREVFLDKVSYNDLPYKFEAGTPNVADVIGLGKAIEYIQEIGIDEISQYEKNLHTYFFDRIKSIKNIQIYTPVSSSSVISFNLHEVHPFDVGQMLDAKGIAIRTGHHCCQPLMRKLGIEGTCRASLAIYNTEEEVDKFILELRKVAQILSA